jgi:YggT family protein
MFLLYTGCVLRRDIRFGVCSKLNGAGARTQHYGSVRSGSTWWRKSLLPRGRYPVFTGYAAEQQRALSKRCLCESLVMVTDVASTWMAFAWGAVTGSALTTPTVANSVQVPAFVAPLRGLLSLVFTTYTVLFLLRFVIPWFPQINAGRPPWSIVVLATEGLLRPTRRIIPPQGGVDITPLVWLALTSLSQELLVGSQGIITLLTR